MSVAYANNIFKSVWRWLRKKLTRDQGARIENGIKEDREDNYRPPPLDRPRKM